MPDESNPRERQPFRGDPNRNNRVYIPATWAEPGEGEGHPKLSGGYEVSRNNGGEAPRGLNRTDQRYTLPASEMQARRQARAAAELPSLIFMQTELGRWECQTTSGKSVDCVPLAEMAFEGEDGELHLCQCEDDWRLRQSGYELATACKHVEGLRLYLDATPVDDQFYSLEWLSEQTGYSLRALEQQAANGSIPADKIGRQWGIPSPLATDTILYLRERVINFPNAIFGE